MKASFQLLNYILPLLIISGFSRTILYAQVTPSGIRSYVLEQTPREAMTTLTNATAYTSVQSTVSYVDGLGRPLQNIVVRGSGDGTKDVVGSTTVYDNFGRSFKNFLPIPNSTAGGAFLANPQTLGVAFYGDTHPYTEVNTFDNSPLNRPITSFGAGQAWRVSGNTKPVNRQYNIPAPNTVIYFQAGLAGIGANTANLTKEQKVRNLAQGISYEFDGITAADYTQDSTNVGNSPNPGTTLRYYGANDLTMTTSMSERGKKIIEYRDLQDRVIRKDVEVSSDTTITVHYVYDIFQRLAYIITPEAYKLFSNTKLSISETDNEFKELIFSYRYDERGRQIRKHIPGVGWTEICYDRLDRPTMSQDPQEASKSPKQWQMLKYDAFGRVVVSGLTDAYNSSDRDALQTAFNGITTPYERRTTSGLLYSNNSYPASVATTDAQIMKVNYYDDYGTDWIPTGLGFLTATGGDAPFSQTQMNGLLLGYKERNLETSVLYTSTMYYDDRKRMVNSNAENHLGGKDRTNINYSFTGEVLKARKIHDKGTTISTILEVSEYVYDHLGRKKSYKHSLNGATQNVGVYTYDAIGRMVQKGLKPAGLAQNSKQTGNWNDVGSWLSNNVPTLSDAVTINTGHTVTILNGQSGSAGNLTDKGLLSIQTGGQFNVGKVNANTLQNVDFSYKIRGSLKGINLDDSGNPVLAGGDLFTMKLGYEDDGTYFDGNIRSQTWISSIDNLSRTYTYRYDGASRIKAGVFTGGKPNENYTLNNVTYDNNGNIKNLIRSGLIAPNTFGIVDNLSYTYNTNSNKILKIDDLSNVTASFTDVAGNDYTYSADGSLTSDANKGIGTIDYNYLKLPKRIAKVGTTILYEYSASGKKLKETIGSQVTDYVGNIIYKNGILYQISHDEGRVIDGQYEYDIKDHLGNLRVAFRDSLGIAKITQANSYGIFGEDLTTLNYLKQSWKDDKFKFTGKEDLPETGYTDFGARLYDKLVPRFITIDPLAETSRRFSPFTYGNNNPIRFIDPDGMESKGYEYSDGYSTMNSANETGSVSHNGTFLNSGRDNENGKGKTIMIAFGGLDTSSKNDKGSAGEIIKDLSAWSKNNNKPFAGLAISSSYTDTDNLNEAINFIMKNYEVGSNDKIVIYGYSWGGDNAVELAKKLDAYGLKINDLITVDGSIGPFSGKFGSNTDFVDREIPSNVIKFSNFYQTNSNKVPFSQGGINTGVSKATTPLNIKYSGSGIDHYSIDDITKLPILNYLKR